MKIKIWYVLAALVLCMGAFFMPLTAYASGEADTTPPVISAEVLDGMLHIEAHDSGCGVDAVYIDGKRVNYRVDNAIDLEFEDFAAPDAETVGVYAIDFAGNQSQTVEVTNPLHKTVPAEKPFTPDGHASVVDNATDGDGKEFFTFTTPEENIFYLVVDRQRESENVYFLNAVTESDLMALAEKEKDGSAASESAVPETACCSCSDRCEAGMVNMDCPVCKNDLKSCVGTEPEPPVTKEPEPEPEQPKKGSGGTMIFVLLAVAVVGGAGYYLKIYKPKHDLDDAEDLDDLWGDDEEPEINEDAELSEKKGAYQTDMENGQDRGKPACDDYHDERSNAEDSTGFDDYPDERYDSGDAADYDDYPDDAPEQGE